MIAGLAGALVLAAALAVAGCGGSDDETSGDTGSSSGEPVEITFWHGQTQGVAVLLQQMIDEFNKTHPDIVVSKDSGGVNSDRMLQKVTAGLQADNYPDIAYIYGSDLANLAGGDQLANLTDAIDAGDIDWDRFEDAAVQAVTVDGQPRAVPAFIDNLALVYNKDIFDAAGMDYPTDDWSWDDFMSAAAELNDPDAGIAGFGWPGTGRRGHDLADLADGLAGRRRRSSARTARASASTGPPASRRSPRSTRQPPTAPSTSTAPPAPSACSSSSRAARWR